MSLVDHWGMAELVALSHPWLSAEQDVSVVETSFSTLHRSTPNAVSCSTCTMTAPRAWLS